MEHQHQNKEFILRYFNAINGMAKVQVLLKRYITDEILIEHIRVFENAFPKYELLADEIRAKDDRVIVKARFRGRHEGELNSISAIRQRVEFPFAIGYELEDNKIISHWMIVDPMAVMKQLGVMGVPHVG